MLFYSGFMEDGTYPARDFISHSVCGHIGYESLSLGMYHLPFSPHRITNIVLGLYYGYTIDNVFGHIFAHEMA